MCFRRSRILLNVLPDVMRSPNVMFDADLSRANISCRFFAAASFDDLAMSDHALSNDVRISSIRLLDALVYV